VLAVVILGIDPGTATTGYAVARLMRDNRLEAAEYGVIRTPANLPLCERLGAIYQAVEDLGRAHKPDAMAVEEIFFGRSARNVFAVGQARGAVLVAAARLGLPVYEYTPMQIKQAVTGYGHADKQQVQQMVKAIFGLSQVPKPDDAADALAVAACCLHSQGLTRAVQQAEERSAPSDRVR
jgi:crossover junction endodeoxyribonuclease RuvC